VKVYHYIEKLGYELLSEGQLPWSVTVNAGAGALTFDADGVRACSSCLVRRAEAEAAVEAGARSLRGSVSSAERLATTSTPQNACVHRTHAAPRLP
jgi:hypothetical protein